MAGMKITINGVVFDNPDTLNIDIETGPDGAEMGPIRLHVLGRGLMVRPRDGEMAVKINYDGEFGLHLGDGDPSIVVTRRIVGNPDGTARMEFGEPFTQNAAT